MQGIKGIYGYPSWQMPGNLVKVAITMPGHLQD